VIKLALFSPKGNYPFNSPQWPDDSKFSDLLTMAQHPYYRSLWSMDAFDTYVLIAYSTVGGAAGGDISYYTRGISAAQIAEETAQFKAASGWLLENYPAKTFVFENWEGDWYAQACPTMLHSVTHLGASPRASRGGSYDAKKPASALALTSMRCAGLAAPPSPHPRLMNRWNHTGAGFRVGRKVSRRVGHPPEPHWGQPPSRATCFSLRKSTWCKRHG
jgi:hypothetical protein